MSDQTRIFTWPEFVETIRHDWLPILLAFAIPLGLALAAAYLSGAYYQASATLLARMGREYLYKGEIGDGPGIGFEREETLKSEVAILTSHDLAEKVVKAMGPERLFPGVSSGGMAASRFLASLDAQLIKDSNVIKVTFRHGDAVLAAESVNRLIRAYLERRHDLYYDTPVAPLELKVKALGEQLARQERAVEDFKKARGIVSLEEERALLLRQRSDLDTRLKAARNLLAEAEYRLSTQKTNVDKAERVGMASVLAGVESEILRLDADRIAARAVLQQQSEQLAELDGRIAAMAQAEREMERLRREAALAAETYRTYSGKLEDARIQDIVNSRRQAANVQLIQEAQPPVQPISYRSVIMAVGGVLGLVAAMVVAFLCEWRRDTFLTPEGLERALGIPVIAEFPKSEVRS